MAKSQSVLVLGLHLLKKSLLGGGGDTVKITSAPGPDHLILNWHRLAVLGIADNLTGQIPIGLLALKAGVTKDNKEIISECIKMVRNKVGPVAAFKVAIIVKRLPKTRSGKILRGTVRKIADNEPYKMPATIDDPVILDEIKADLIENNILKI